MNVTPTAIRANISASIHQESIIALAEEVMNCSQMDKTVQVWKLTLQFNNCLFLTEDS